MQEKTLRNLALFCSIIGLITLFYVSGFVSPVQIKIEQITIEDLGKEVFVCGVVGEKKVSNNHIFLDIIDDTGTIKLVVFNKTAIKLTGSGTNPYDIEKGDIICANGVIDEYPKGSGDLELVYRKGTFEKI